MKRNDVVMPRTKGGSVYEPSSENAPDSRVVTVDRARFERLREYVAASEAFMAFPEPGHKAGHAEFAAAHDRVIAAQRAVLPTDTDPLP